MTASPKGVAPSPEVREQMKRSGNVVIPHPPREDYSTAREETIVCPKCGNIKGPGDRDYFHPTSVQLIKAVNGLVGWKCCKECQK